MTEALNPFEPPKAALDTPIEVEAAPALWNPNAAGLWSVLLTPIFGSVLIRKNWRALGDESKVRAGTAWLVVSVLVLLPSIMFGIGAFIYLIVWYLAWQKPQAKYVRERWGNGYPRKGWGVPLATGFAIYVALIVVLVGLAALYAGPVR